MVTTVMVNPHNGYLRNGYFCNSHYHRSSYNCNSRYFAVISTVTIVMNNSFFLTFNTTTFTTVMLSTVILSTLKRTTYDTTVTLL